MSTTASPKSGPMAAEIEVWMYVVGMCILGALICIVR